MATEELMKNLAGDHSRVRYYAHRWNKMMTAAWARDFSVIMLEAQRRYGGKGVADIIGQSLSSANRLFAHARVIRNTTAI